MKMDKGTTDKAAADKKPAADAAGRRAKKGAELKLVCRDHREGLRARHAGGEEGPASVELVFTRKTDKT